MTQKVKTIIKKVNNVDYVEQIFIEKKKQQKSNKNENHKLTV